LRINVRRIATLLLAVAAGCAKDPDYSTHDAGTGDTGAVMSACPADASADAPAIDVGGGAPDAGGLNCAASCEFAGGVAVGCATRFQYGINFAWDQFAGDFGGISHWCAPGVSRNARVRGELADMRANGVDTIRWWVFPDFRGDGVALDGEGTPTGLGGTALADVNAALALAAEAGVHVQFCLFSFDNFKPDRTLNNGRFIRGIRSIILDETKRAALMQAVVRPFARAVTTSPNAARAVAWDVINEPEWAISGSDAYGDMGFTPQTTVETVSHTEMETFVRDVIAAIRAESSLPITVGSAAAKWPKAWSGVDVDFYSIHIYDWINMQWPYSASASELGLMGKPVVVGEFPVNGLTGVPYSQMVESWYGNGYAGALGWAVNGGGSNAALSWSMGKAGVKAFADAKGCSTAY
jgi:hypothetical protein